MGVRDEFRSAGLARPRQGRIIAGVCAGLGRRFGLDPWLVRVLAIVSLLLPGPQFVAYIVLWVLMPPDPP
jgi:phage shock protein PspC (stress-responsive transcriptional regulator)